MMTGQVGRRDGPASAARPEQRAGRIRRRPDPDDVPDYQRVDNASSTRSSRRCGDATLDPKPG
jgi:hypothetical protein